MMCCPLARFLLLVGVAGLVLVGGLSCRREGPDGLGKVPAFELTERSGQTVSDATLRGKVWIASFVFTRCTGPCPQVTVSYRSSFLASHCPSCPQNRHRLMRGKRFRRPRLSRRGGPSI